MTNIFNGTIDICNQLVLLSTIPTTQQLSGANYLSNIRFKYVSTIYDLAQVYEINSAVVNTNPPLNIFANYNSVKTDIGYIFKKPIVASQPFTLNTSTSTNIMNSGNYYSIIGSKTSSTTANFTVNGPINITILMIGPGGNGGNTTGVTNVTGTGGSGGQLYYAQITLPSGSYTATAGAPGTNTTFTNGTSTITAYAGLNGTSTSGTAAFFTLCPTTSSNPSAFTVIGTATSYIGGRGAGYPAPAGNPQNAYGGPGYRITSGPNYSIFIDTSSIANIGTNSYTYWNGTTLSTGTGNRITRNSLNANFGTKIIKTAATVTTNIYNQTNSSTSYGFINGFCCGGGGGVRTVGYGGGTGGAYDIGGSNNSGNFANYASNYSPQWSYTDIGGNLKYLYNGGDGVQFGCGGGGANTQVGSTGGTGAPGAIFIYYG